MVAICNFFPSADTFGVLDA